MAWGQYKHGSHGYEEFMLAVLDGNAAHFAALFLASGQLRAGSCRSPYGTARSTTQIACSPVPETSCQELT